MPAPRLILVLSENWTPTDPRDLPALVRIAVEAEDAGFDGVMVSEHIVLGPGSDANGLMANPREYALPGNQEMVGGIRPTFPDAHRPAPIAPALKSIAGQVARGFGPICVKPSRYTDDPAEVGPLCREIVRRVAAM